MVSATRRVPSLIRVRTLWTFAIIAVFVLLVTNGASDSAASSAAPLATSLQTLPGARVEPTGVSCMPNGVCVAVDYDGDFFVLSGGRGAELGPSGYYLFAISCASIRFCIAVGNSTAVRIGADNEMVAYTLNGPQSHASVHWESVSCPSVSYCVAGGGVLTGSQKGAGVVASWNGRTWSTVKVVDPRRSGAQIFISSMSCTGSRFCVAADGNGRVLQSMGRSGSHPICRTGQRARPRPVSRAPRNVSVSHLEATAPWPRSGMAPVGNLHHR